MARKPATTVRTWMDSHPKFPTDAQQRDYNFASRGVTAEIEADVKRVLLQAVEAGHRKVWLRIDPPRKLGQVLRASRHWIDGTPTEQTLPGTAVLDPSAWRLIAGYLRAFPGARVHAVTGDRVGKGEDVGEALVKGAIVVGV